VYFRTSRIFTIAAAAAVFGVMAAPARAQQATFHLPFEARWGRVTLDPGEYKLSARLGVSGAHMIQLVGPSKRGIIVPALTSTEGATDRSYLECIKVNGTYVVRRYVTAFSGQVFNFGVAKSEPERRATSSVPALLVPVERVAE
jgi:hypothetical protein